MDDTAVLLILFVASLCCCCCTNPVSLSVLPQSSLFEGGFFILRCELLDSTDEWTVVRNTSKQTETPCGAGWGKVMNKSCKVGLAVTWDTGIYWCESKDGRSSSSVSVRVSAGQIMVVTPYFPVAVGEDVTLKCLTKTPSNRNAHFYKNGLLINPEPTRQLTIRRISNSAEGLYKCNISDLESPPSRLSVSDHSGTVTVSEFTPTNSATSASDPGSDHFPLGFRLLFHLLVFCPYFVSTVLMVSLYRQIPQENELPVSKERDEDCEDATAAVTTVHKF